MAIPSWTAAGVTSESTMQTTTRPGRVSGGALRALATPARQVEGKSSAGPARVANRIRFSTAQPDSTGPLLPSPTTVAHRRRRPTRWREAGQPGPGRRHRTAAVPSGFAGVLGSGPAGFAHPGGVAGQAAGV